MNKKTPGAPPSGTMMHWGLDVHAVDRDSAPVLQFDHHAVQRGQGEGHGARADRVLVVSTLTHRERHRVNNVRLTVTTSV